MRPLARLAELWRRLLYGLQRERRERELQEEMAEHRARMADPERFGSTLRIGDEAREVWGWVWLDQLLQDLRIAVRSLGRERAFSLTASSILALSIGAVVAIFSVVDAVLLERLPFREPETLVAVWEHSSEREQPQLPVAPVTLKAWGERSRSFSGMAALSWRSFELHSQAEPARVQAQAVSPELFEMLGVSPVLGRSFLPGEGEPGASRVALLSHGAWQNRFGGDTGVIGRDILLDDESFRIVGVLPPRFQLFESYIGLWVPLALSPEQWEDTGNELRVVARLRPGVRLEQARREMEAVAAAVDRDRPEASGTRRALLVPLERELSGGARPALLLLLAAVGVVLLAACTNLGGLFLTRGLARQRELAIRASLGASRGRLVRQLVAESLLVAVPGTAAGVALAHLSLPLLAHLVPPQRALSATLAVDARVLGFAAVLSALAVVAFGLLPALRVARREAGAAALARAGGRLRLGRAHALLVVTEVAVALLLVAEAALLAQSLGHLRGQYAGLRPDRLLTLRTALSVNRYWNAPRRAAFYEDVLARVESLPGVRSAGYTTSLPLEWRGGAHEVLLEGRPAAPGRPWFASHRQVSARYLQTLGAELLAGRFPAEGDAAGAPLVVVVNETLARSFWPGRAALGQRLALAPGQPWRTVVGVVADVRQMGATEPVQAEMYLPHQQVTSHAFLRPRDLVARVEVAPENLVAPIREIVHAVDPLQPVALVRTYEEILDEVSAARRVQRSVLAGFAALALLLAALGIHGVLAHWVAQRRIEIGVRVALGAHPLGVLAGVLGRGARLTALGVGAGLLASLAVAPLTRHLLFEVAPTDPATHLAVVALLSVVALASCLGPAWRAARVDPARSLRAD